MKSIEHVTLPDDVYDQIERRAQAAGRSAAEEAADMLARAAAADAKEAELLAEIRLGHEEMAKKGINATPEDILSAVEWGRE